MSTKKPNLNKEQWNQKWDKEPVRYKLDKSEEKEGPKPRKSSLTLNEPPRRTARSVSASKTAASADKSTASVPKTAASAGKSTASDTEKNTAEQNKSAGGAGTAKKQSFIPPFFYGNGEPPKNEDGKKKLLTVLSVVGGIVLFFLILFIILSSVRGCSLFGIPGGNGKGASSSPISATERANTLALAKRYADRGEYERAMDLLDQLLIQNADDAEILQLNDDILSRKEAQEAGQ